MLSDNYQEIAQNYPKSKKPIKYQQQDSGFKAWDNDSILNQNNTNLLRNLKSQLLTYQEKYKKLDTNKTVPIKLPVLQYMKNKKYSVKNHKKNLQNLTQDNALTQRKTIPQQQNQNLYKHRSIQLYKKCSSSKDTKRLASQKHKVRHQNYTIDQNQQKNQPILITKVQQMKFSQNQKRIRKRDLYLAIFGQRGKGKVQKLQFDDQNKAYQSYLQRRNLQMNNCKVVSMCSGLLKQQQKSKVKCSSQLNNRYLIKKQQLSINVGGNVNINNMMNRINNNIPMRY